MKQTINLYQDDLLLLTFAHFQKKRPNRSTYTIYLDNGNTIELHSLDAVSRIEGVDNMGIVFDEVEDMNQKERDTFLDARIMPALQTEYTNGYKSQMIIIATPEQNGLIEKLVTTNCIKSKLQKNYTQPSSRVLSEETLKAVRETTDPDLYAQEYEAKFIKPKGTIYYNYDSQLNNTDLEVKTYFTLHWFHDQNHMPLSSGIGIKENDTFYILDEFFLHNSDSFALMKEFLHRYRNHKNKNIFIWGDSYGNAHFSNYSTTYYEIISKTLKENGWNPIINVPSHNPPILSRINSVKSVILNANNERKLFVNINKCNSIDIALRKSKIKKGTSTEIDTSLFEHHIGEALGYQIHPVVNENKLKSNTIAGIL